jgi:hypothetical protein
LLKGLEDAVHAVHPEVGRISVRLV